MVVEITTEVLTDKKLYKVVDEEMKSGLENT